MAKGVNRGLGALAALGALSYHLSKGRGRTDGGAPVDDRNTGAVEDAAATPDVSDPAAMFRAQERAERATPAMPPAVPASVRPSAGGAIPAPTPAAMAVAPNAADMFRAQERAERGTPAMRNPNISEEVAQRTGVKLDSRAGAGRGIQGGPTAEELDAYASRKRGAGAGRGGQGGPTAAELAAYREQQRLDKLRSSGGMRAKGGAIKAKAKPKKMASGGMTSASKRADGIASKGKTKCKMY